MTDKPEYDKLPYNVKTVYEGFGRKPTEETNVGKAVREYDELHAACPACGSRNYETTLMGYHMEYSPEVRVVENRNRVSCQVCKWAGRGHELVPGKK